jgi:hypothetical protein
MRAMRIRAAWIAAALPAGLRRHGHRRGAVELRAVRRGHDGHGVDRPAPTPCSAPPSPADCRPSTSSR